LCTQKVANEVVNERVGEGEPLESISDADIPQNVEYTIVTGKREEPQSSDVVILNAPDAESEVAKDKEREDEGNTPLIPGMQIIISWM
jgi:hypothetical protein